MIVSSRVEDEVDGSFKVTMETPDGSLVEAVRFIAWDGIPNICVSCQIGCSFACTHCATGTMPLTRNLTAGEMIEQVAAMSEPGETVHVLYMGMGEPFANLGEIIHSIDMLISSGWLEGREQAFLCTSGIRTSWWRDLAQLPRRPHLTISLHAGTDATRARIIPHAAKMSLTMLADTIRHYVEATGNIVDLNYTVLRGVNDDDENFIAFAKYARSLGCRARIIPFNTWRGAPFAAAQTDRIDRLCEVLSNHSVPVLFRPSSGSRIGAGCGQLVTLSR
jgi:23S rRNA (adenine2503-C2)-methyltransferase